MVYRLTVYRLQDDHSFLRPIFLFQHVDLTEIKDQPCLHFLDAFFQAAYCSPRKARDSYTLMFS
jgi:hypothetical protein